MHRFASLAVFLLVGCGARTIELDPESELPGPAGDTGIVVTDSAVPGADATPRFDDGPIVVDAGPPGRPITCGMRTCTTTTEECCFESEEDPPRCTPKGTCAGASLSCSSALSCNGGERCCFDQDFGQAACKSSCERSEITLCTTNAECPTGSRCRRAGGGLSACQRG